MSNAEQNAPLAIGGLVAVLAIAIAANYGAHLVKQHFRIETAKEAIRLMERQKELPR